MLLRYLVLALAMVAPLEAELLRMELSIFGMD